MSRLSQIWLFLFLLFVFTNGFSQQQTIKTFAARTFYEDNGLLSNHIFATAQHSRGEMWFGTSKGISTFDGVRWKQVPGSADFPFYHRSMLVSLPGDSMIQLGLQTRTSMAVRLYHRDSITELANFPIKSIKGGQRAFNAAVLKNGAQLQIVLQIEEYLWIYKNSTGKWQKQKLPESIRPSELTKLVYYKNALVVSTTQGLYSLHPNTGKFQQLWPTLLEDKVILSATTSADGEKLYLLGNNWVAEWNNNRLRFLVDSLFPKDAPFVPAYNYNIIATQAGLLVFQIGNSLFLINPSTGFLEPFRLTNSFAATTPTALLEDNEQNLWFTTLRGVALLNSLRFATMDKVVGLPDSEISTIFQIDSGAVLLGNNLGINILKDYRWQQKAGGELLYNNANNNYRIMDAKRQNDGQLFIAGNSQGIGIMQQDYAITWHELPDDQLAVSLGEWNGQVVIGTNKGRLLSFLNNQFHTLTELKQKSYVRKLHSDKDGNLLILTTHGIYRFDGLTSERLGPPQNTSNLFSILEWQGQTLLGTINGLYKLEADQLIPISDSIAVDRPIYALLADKQGRLWMGTDKGVYIYNNKKLTNYNRYNGLSGQEINRSALVEMKDDRIWIGTDRGLSIYDPHYDFERTVVPRLRINEIRTHDQLLTGKQQQELDADQSLLEFTFHAVSFYFPEGLVYRYRLEGLDTDWTYTENYLQNFVRYNSLPAGKFRFAIQARIQDGPWSTPQYSPYISIAPPFYTSWWFLAAVVLGIGLIGYTLHSFILHKGNEKRLKVAIQEKVNQIEESEAKFKAIWDAMDTAVAIVSKEATILMANPSFERLFAQHPGPLMGTQIPTLLQHSRFSKESIAEWYRKPALLNFELETTFEGAPIFLLSTFNHLHKFSPNERLLLIGLKNISDQKGAEMKNLRLNELLVRQNRDLVKKELELATFNLELLKRQEELQAALGVLEERNFELDQFVYKTSHDLRAPIASAIGLLNIMKMEGMTSSWPGYIEMIMRSLQKQDSFIKAMLNFSKTARAVEKPELIELKHLIEQCYKDLQYLPGYDEIEKNIQVKTLNGNFYSDRMKINIILSNILSNSIKYRDAKKQSYLAIDIETSHDYAQILIRDNGIGIDKKYLNHIFDMFYRATERSDGSGLGLYIVKQTLERLGGKIEASSELGVGSCFKIVIPNLVAKVEAAEKRMLEHESGESTLS